jgi:hypothetical protein
MALLGLAMGLLGFARIDDKNRRLALLMVIEHFERMRGAKKSPREPARGSEPQKIRPCFADYANLLSSFGKIFRNFALPFP